jgi:hypothetical protein
MPGFTPALRHDTPARMRCCRVPAKDRPTVDQRTAARAELSIGELGY